MRPIVALLPGFAGVAALLFVAWLAQLRSRNAGLADSLWAWGLGSLGVWLAWAGSAPPVLRGLLAVMAGLWGFRLGLHLLLRNHGRPEDGRYRRFREQWGRHADRKLFWFFQLQAMFALLLAPGFAVIAWRPDLPGTAAITISILSWLSGVGGEALADAQLERFRRDPATRGLVCRRGLWRWSRHPNYFFECLHWVAYLPLAIGAPWWGLALLPPAVITLLLLRWSGIPLTEAQAAATPPEYADYIRSTSAFIPRPPKSRPGLRHPDL